MKRILAILILACLSLASCNTRHLPIDPDNITKIKIGTGKLIGDEHGIINDGRQDRTVLEKRESVVSFLTEFSFGREGKYTVKHVLPAYVEFHSSTGKVAHLRFENRMMRFDGKEYVLSRGTAQMLQEYLKK